MFRLAQRRISLLAGLLIVAIQAVQFRQASAGAISKIRNSDRQSWKTNQRLANKRGGKRLK